jgi:alpha-L-fucosidase
MNWNTRYEGKNMQKQKSLLLLGIFGFILTSFSCTPVSQDLTPNPVIPSPRQVEYQEMEFIGFIHFTVNTFTDKEWGFGDESPEIFNPTEFDANQWAQVAKEAGMKQLILTAKHHDGFCLWPSKYTEHSVKNSPWKNGQGDIVQEFVDACRRHGLKAGLYLSPWDRNHPDYGNPEYIDYYHKQLQELLTEYGEISEIWFDGANGGSGYYGGTRETRRIDQATYYRWPETWALVKELQPQILIFSDAGPDIRWIGNEKGYAGITNWSMLSTDDIIVGAADNAYLNSGDPEGQSWVIPLCNTSIRPGWFYHKKEDSQVKSLQQLLDVYYKSVGRNGVLLLNLPPDTRGLIHENDIRALQALRSTLDEAFASNIASGKSIQASNTRKGQAKFAPENLLDNDSTAYWAAEDTVREASLEIDLGERSVFDRILLQEPIRLGQRISRFAINAFIQGKWVPIAQGTTIGYKRLLRIPAVTTDKVQIVIKNANNVPALSHFGLFLASPAERPIQAISLLGEALYSAPPAEAAVNKFNVAKGEYEKDTGNPDKLIWYGRWMAYLGKYREAIDIYTQGIAQFPQDARFLRHRGHRYISIREFDKAIQDLEKAAVLIDGTEDRVEPDGMPNAQNIPISSLHSNIWYHLGLAYYLKNDLENALRVYRIAVETSTNSDKLISTTHWFYMILRLLGREEEATKALDPVEADMDIIENMAYHRLCLLYKGKLAIDDLTDPEFSNIMNDAVAYGIGNWYFYNGEKDKALQVFEKILKGKTWASFGYIAAEADYLRNFK